MIQQEEIKQDVLNALQLLKPEREEQFDTTWEIFTKKYSLHSVEASGNGIGQHVLADLLRPIAQGHHERHIHIFYKHLVTVNGGIVEVDFLFKWF